ncbi:MAG: fimbrillin family protein [Candidatus Cryptobacteroides sp.]
MRKSLFLTGLALVAAACAGEKVETSVPGKVAIVPVMTRATDVNFENGDAIGVNIVRGDESYAVNNKLTYASDVFSGTLLWYPEAMDKSTVTAYYPYQSAGVPASFSVAADQTAGLSGSDFIAGVKADVTPSINAIVVPFKHMLTKIVLNVTNESGASISEVALGGSKLTTDIDLVAMTASASETSEVAEIKACEVEAGVRYAAIVVPQTVGFALKVTTSTGAELSQNLVSTELKQGGQYTINVKVLPADIKVSLSGEIENWTDEGEIGTDKPTYIDFAEYDGYFIYKNERYNTVTLSNGSVWMAQPMRYVPEGYEVSTDPTTGHIWAPYTVVDTEAVPSTDKALVESNGYLYDMLAILGTTEITDENAATFEGAQGICPNGWHVPTRAEFIALCGYSNKAAGESAAVTDNNAVFYDATYNGGKITAMNEAGWNVVLGGWMNKTGFTATPKYHTTLITVSGAPEAFLGKPGMTYFASSTYYKTNTSNMQYFAAATSFTTSYPEGRFMVMYQHYEAGSQLRCVKNSGE